MNQKVLTVLEYNKIIERLSALASSPLGKEKVMKLQPMSDLDQIKEAQNNTADALSRLFKRDGISFGSNKPVGRSLRSLEIGATLSIAELLAIAALLDNVGRVKSYGKPERADEPADSLTEMFDGLVLNSQIAQEIHRCILSEDEIADDASSNLKSIRRNIGLANDKIKSQLNAMLNGQYRTYLQDAVITQRDGRYCIPVKAEYKGQVPGMVHDQSSTGSTVFIEPQAIVNLNNQIRELQIEEKKEIEVILETLSKMTAEETESIANDQKIMTRLDVIFAKGRLAMEQNASRPVFNNKHIINIRKGRHPLLDQKKVVPIDVRLGEDFDLLVVTGPNTGGKTVSLKTVGLLTLMGQAGLHIPAGDRSQLAVFTKVYADIGDEQSIEQSLSTFSSHMKNIVAILKNADENSLCLFDELGAGTDPTEGAALAIAILDYLHKRGIRSMATTHYSELKVYALSTDKVENACCEFDVETLSPTYKLLIGIPGKSNAFAISKRLGLREDIIEEAKLHITEDKENFEDLISDLENSRRIIEKERAEIAEYKAKIKTHQDALEKKRDKIDDSRDEILRKAREEAQSILREAKDVADETIRTFQKAGPGASMKDLEKARDKVRNKQKDNDAGLTVKNTDKPKKQIKPSDIKLGMDVKIVSMGLKGTVNSLPDAKGNITVSCGIMKSKTNINDIIIIDDGPIIPKKGVVNKNKSEASKIKMNKSYSVTSEINLLGKTVDEAIYELDKYLDDAYLAHMPSVRIVHGKGTGALRQAVQSKLRKTKYIESFRGGEYGEGDAGVTIATFKD
ncbi:MAG: endonuclease MutS2 [Lachnospiraceae bacterium]|nr:endonuclease MutS2 [Candidatus Colinaster scatohippi]